MVDRGRCILVTAGAVAGIAMTIPFAVAAGMV